MKLKRIEYNGEEYAHVSQRVGSRLATAMVYLERDRWKQAAAIRATRREVREFIKREDGRG